MNSLIPVKPTTDLVSAALKLAGLTPATFTSQTPGWKVGLVEGIVQVTVVGVYSEAGRTLKEGVRKCLSEHWNAVDTFSGFRVLEKAENVPTDEEGRWEWESFRALYEQQCLINKLLGAENAKLAKIVNEQAPLHEQVKAATRRAEEAEKLRDSRDVQNATLIPDLTERIRTLLTIMRTVVNDVVFYTDQKLYATGWPQANSRLMDDRGRAATTAIARIDAAVERERRIAAGEKVPPLPPPDRLSPMPDTPARMTYAEHQVIMDQKLTGLVNANSQQVEELHKLKEQNEALKRRNQRAGLRVNTLRKALDEAKAALRYYGTERYYDRMYPMYRSPAEPGPVVTELGSLARRAMTQIDAYLKTLETQTEDE